MSEALHNEISELRQRLLKMEEIQKAGDEHTRKVLEENTLLKKSMKEIAVYQCLNCGKIRLNRDVACTCGHTKAPHLWWDL